MVFKDAAAADVMLRNKAKLPKGVYVEPVLTKLEVQEKAARMMAYRAMKADNRIVSWRRAEVWELKGVDQGGSAAHAGAIKKRWAQVVMPVQGGKLVPACKTN